MCQSNGVIDAHVSAEDTFEKVDTIEQFRWLIPHIPINKIM